jgi:hypothetical protein
MSNTLLRQLMIDKDIISGVGTNILALQTQVYVYDPLFDPDPGQSVTCLTQEHQDNLGCYDDQEEPYEEDSAGPLISDANKDTPDPFAIECNGSDRQHLQQLNSSLATCS